MTAFANLIGVLICVVLLLTVVSDLYPTNPSLFELTGRSALFLALIGCLLVAGSARISHFPTYDSSTATRQKARLSVIMAFVAMLITTAIIGIQGDLHL